MNTIENIHVIIHTVPLEAASGSSEPDFHNKRPWPTLDCASTYDDALPSRKIAMKTVL